MASPIEDRDRERGWQDVEGRILAGFAPGGIEGFFRAAGTAATDAGSAPSPQPIGAAFQSAAETHGMRVL